MKLDMFSRVRRSFGGIGNRFYGKVGIIGVPFDKGQCKVGVSRGPDAIRAAGLVEELRYLGKSKIDRITVERDRSFGQVEKIVAGVNEDKYWSIIAGLDVKDYGNVFYEVEETRGVDNMSHLGEVSACTRRLSKMFQRVMKDGRKVLTLGGDHSLGIGTIDGHVKARKEIAVLWIDAHADLNTNKTSDSGNVHGMPVALLTSELADYWPHLPGMDWQQPMLSIRNVAYIGLRSVDRYERLVIEKFGITAFGMEDVERFGIHEVIHMALDRVDPRNEKSLHISFDIDSLDPLEAPSTGTPVRGGLSLREGIHLMEELYRTDRLNAVDLVEVNPEIGDKNCVDRTVGAAIHVIQAALGYTRRGLRVPEGITDMPLQTFR